MRPSNPHDHLYVLAQDRAMHMERARLSRIVAARADLARRERRVEDAWHELVQAIEDVGGARRALVAIELD